MTTDFTNGIVAILSKAGYAVGAGFVVHADGLIATCAHVLVESVFGEVPGEGEEVVIRFKATGQTAAAIVTPYYSTEEDVAILRVESLPDGVEVLPLCAAAGTEARTNRYGLGACVKARTKSCSHLEQPY